MEAEIPPNAKFTVETITQVQRWTDKLFSFRITRPQGYSFAAGQYSRLGLRIDGLDIWRAYSVVSAPDDDFLEYYSIVVPGGTFTTSLKDLEAGSPILLDKQAFGFMTPDRFEDGAQLWMLSTGTGLGPFLSMLQDRYVWEKFQQLILVHCVRKAEEFAYGALLDKLQRSAPPGALQVIRTTTRDATPPGDAVDTVRLGGRITSLLENGELEKAAGFAITPDNARVMLCGNPEMIEDTRRILHGRGMRPCRRALPGQFVTENYW